MRSLLHFWFAFVSSFFLLWLLWWWVFSAYLPTWQDQEIQKNISYKIQKLERSRLVTIANKIVTIHQLFAWDSREWYLLNWLYDEIVLEVERMDALVKEAKTIQVIETVTYPVSDSKIQVNTDNEVVIQNEQETSSSVSLQGAESEDSLEDEEVLVKELFEISWKNYEYSQTELEVWVWTEITLIFSTESWYHDLVIEELWVATQKVDATDWTTSVTFIADTIGEFEYFCSVWDHRAQWMVWLLRVVDETGSIWWDENWNWNSVQVRVVRNRAYVDLVWEDIEESTYYSYSQFAREDIEDKRVLSKIASRHNIQIDDLARIATFTHE